MAGVFDDLYDSAGSRCSRYYGTRHVTANKISEPEDLRGLRSALRLPCISQYQLWEAAPMALGRYLALGRCDRCQNRFPPLPPQLDEFRNTSTLGHMVQALCYHGAASMKELSEEQKNLVGISGQSAAEIRQCVEERSKPSSRMEEQRRNQS